MKINSYGIRLVLYAAMGVAVVGFIWRAEMLRREEERQKENPIPVLLQRRDVARGPSRSHEYAPTVAVRVTALAPAKRGDGTWIVLAPNTFLKVVSTLIDGDNVRITVQPSKELGLSVTVSGTLSAEETAIVHSTFLEAWSPEVVDGILEIGNCKLVSSELMGWRGNVVRGMLRNVSAGEIKGCVVTAQFIGKDEKPIGEAKTPPVRLAPGQLLQFSTPSSRIRSSKIALQIQFTDATGQKHQAPPLFLVIPPSIR